VESRRKRLYIFRVRILLAYLSIYGGREGLYRKYKELAQGSAFPKILPERLI